MYDNDDEVRDRAPFRVCSQRSGNKEGSGDAGSDCPLGALESSLRTYISEPSVTAFDIAAVDHSLEVSTPKGGDKTQSVGSAKASALHLDKELEESQSAVANLPEFAQFGPISR